MVAVTLLAGLSSQAMAQAYAAVIIDKQRSFTIKAAQVMELLPIVGQPFSGPVRSEVTNIGYVSKTDYAPKAPSWEVLFQGKKFSSDSTVGSTSDSGSANASKTSTTTRYSLPAKIVGPATLRIKPAKDSPFIFNYRLVANK